VKHSAAFAVLNRILASADVMIWTVMNTQRSAKIMRLIDLLTAIGADLIRVDLDFDEKG
jgi:hypothetical protein